MSVRPDKEYRKATATAGFLKRFVMWLFNFAHPAPEQYRNLKIVLPDGFMNVVVTKDNRLTANTNNSAKWDILSFPLPDGDWKIKNHNKKHLTLIRHT